MREMSKKGLSPIIATVLLISLVLVLAVIIFLWARAFIPEKVQKFDSPIENACNSVVFEAAYGSATGLTVQNNGNIALYGVQIGIKRGIGSLEYVDVAQPSVIVAGGQKSFQVSGVTSGNEIVVVPVLLGKLNSGELRAFACGDASAKTIQA